jgi:hypothetical protein
LLGLLSGKVSRYVERVCEVQETRRSTVVLHESQPFYDRISNGNVERVMMVDTAKLATYQLLGTKALVRRNPVALTASLNSMFLISIWPLDVP